MNRIISIGPAFLIIAALVLSSVAQKPSAAKPNVEQKPFLVKANLLVLDAANAPVGDVKLTDIKIFEDEVEQKPTYFAAVEPGLNVALVVDNSGSLRPHIGAVTKAAALIAVNLADNDKALVVRFVSSEKIEVLQNWTSNKSEIVKVVQSQMYIEGGQSAVVDAVYLAADELQKVERSAKGKRNAIVLLTDGDDRSSFYDLRQLVALFEGSDIQVFSVGFPAPGNEAILFGGSSKKKIENLLDVLAFTTHGKAFVLGERYKEERLLEALKLLMIELRSQYVVGYTSTNPNRDGKERKLRVEIADGANGAKRIGYIRGGFVVPK